MKRVMYAVSNVVYFISNPERSKFKNFYNEIFSRRLRSISDSINSHVAKIYNSNSEVELNLNWNIANRTLKYTFEREMKTLSSTKRLDERFSNWIERRNRDFEKIILSLRNKMENEVEEFAREKGWIIKEMSLSKEEKDLETWIPKRADGFRLPLRIDYLDDVLGEGTSKALPLRDPVLYELINFSDGRRTLLEIYERLVEEFGIIDLKKFKDTFDILSRAKLMDIKRKG